MALNKESIDSHTADCATPTPRGSNVRLRVLQREQMERSLFSCMERFSEFDAMSLTQLEIRLTLLDRQFEKFEQLQSELELLDESQFIETNRERFETAYIEVKTRLAERIALLRL